MGIGSAPAGTTLLGLDAQVLSTVRARKTPGALKFDGTTKDFVASSDGDVEHAHPVDARMFNVCRIAQGSLRSLSTRGQTLKQSKYIDRVNLQARVDNIIRLAAKSLIEAGEVVIIRNEVEVSRGTLKVRVNYFNNKTGRVVTTES